MSTRLSRSLTLVGACALVAACSKSSNNADTTAAGAGNTASAAAAPTATPTPAAPALNDANIAALLDEANAADSAAGKLASTKGTNSEVKAFGRQMAHDHHELRQKGADLAKKLKLTPQAPANDTLPAAAKKMSDSLSAQPKGAAWDKAYIDNEVAVHQSVVSLLQTAQGAAQDSSLKALITSAIPLVQGHLAKAQNIQTKLGNAPATSGGKDSAAKGAKKAP